MKTSKVVGVLSVVCFSLVIFALMGLPGCASSNCSLCKKKRPTSCHLQHNHACQPHCGHAPKSVCHLNGPVCGEKHPCHKESICTCQIAEAEECSRAKKAECPPKTAKCPTQNCDEK